MKTKRLFLLPTYLDKFVECEVLSEFDMVREKISVHSWIRMQLSRIEPFLHLLQFSFTNGSHLKENIPIYITWPVSFHMSRNAARLWWETIGPGKSAYQVHSQNWSSVEDGDSILKLLRGVCRPEIQLVVGIISYQTKAEWVQAKPTSYPATRREAEL